MGRVSSVSACGVGPSVSPDGSVGVICPRDARRVRGGATAVEGAVTVAGVDAAAEGL